MKKNFEELRSQMGRARIACSDERAQKILDMLIVEGLKSGESVPMNDVYWTDLRKRVSGKIDREVSG